MRFILKPILHLAALILYRVKKVGENNIPKDGRYILCGNHVHALDAPVIIVVAKRKIRFIAKEELYKNSFLKWLGGVFDVITIKRGAADMDAMKKSIKALNNGDIIGIFPEGTRHGLDKNVEVKTGAAFLALKTNTPVIPVGIQGSFKPFTKVVLNFGEKMDFSQYASKKPDKEVLEKVTHEIMNRVVELSKKS